MVRTALAVVILAGAPALALAQSTSAPLIVSATVVSSCNVDVPRTSEPATLSALLAEIICVRRGADVRGQHPTAPPRREIRDGVLTINF